MSPAQTLLGCKDVQSQLSISRSTIYRWIDTNGFPKPLKLGPNRIMWKQSDINDWLEQLS